MVFRKFTTGQVVQTFEEKKGKYVCTDQEFVAGDQVDYEDEDGEPLLADEDFDTADEIYCAMNMVEALK